MPGSRGSPLSFSSTPTECAEIKRMYKKKRKKQRKSKRKKKERGEDTTAQQGRGADIMNVVN